MADGSVVIDTKLDDGGFKKGLSGLGSLGKTALKGVAVGVGAVATAFAGVVTASVKARGEMEQQWGGVQTLFKDSADIVKENAEKAYKEAGISATDYMKNVTSFSASLLQSTAGDTKKAAEIADTAMKDMSDNANKFGTDMGSIQNAYQGFAKQNYTMLDNLKLGYGGTKTEMERLLADAQKITGVKYDIKNLSDVYTAIHVIQKELGVTGTTAKEATETLQGSFGMLKASWENFLSGSGKLSQVVESVKYVAQNIIRIVGEAIPDIIDGIKESLPEFIKLGEDLLNNLIDGLLKNLPTLLESAGQIVNSLIQGIIDLLPKIIPVGLQALQMLVQAVLTNLPLIFEAAMKIIPEITRGVVTMLPTLIPEAVKCIITIVETLLDNLDLLVDASVQIIFSLADGLIEALPILIDKAPEIIEKLVMALARNLPKIVEAGVKLIEKLISGLVRALPKIAEAIPKIIKTIYKGLVDGVVNMALAGAKLIEGLWKGIKDMRQWIWDQIKEFCSGIVDKVKGFFGIHSPSKVFQKEIGRFLGLGLGKGFEDSLPNVFKNMKSAVDFETQKLSANLSTQATFGRTLNANITLESPDIYMDSTKVGRVVTPVVSKTLRTGGAY